MSVVQQSCKLQKQQQARQRRLEGRMQVLEHRRLLELQRQRMLEQLRMLERLRMLGNQRRPELQRRLVRRRLGQRHNRRALEQSIEEQMPVAQKRTPVVLHKQLELLQLQF